MSDSGPMWQDVFARRLLLRLLGADEAQRWTTEAVYAYLAEDGYCWDGIGWYPARDEQGEIDLVAGESHVELD